MFFENKGLIIVLYFLLVLSTLVKAKKRKAILLSKLANINDELGNLESVNEHI